MVGGINHRIFSPVHWLTGWLAGQRPERRSWSMRFNDDAPLHPRQNRWSRYLITYLVNTFNAHARTYSAQGRDTLLVGWLGYQ